MILATYVIEKLLFAKFIVWGVISGVVAMVILGGVSSSFVLAQGIGFLPKGDQFRFSKPLDCSHEDDCYVIQYVDVQGGATGKDFSCGHRSENGNRSTDYGITDIGRIWTSPVAVIASADGVVVNRRDGISDVSLIFGGSAIREDLEIGNFVEISHGEDWSSVYGHLRNGSVTVEPGMFVQRGDVIGFVGLSGATVYPHLRFELLKNGRPMDPYSGLGIDTGCDVQGTETNALLDSDALRAFPYERSVLVALGFSADDNISVLGALNGSLLRNYIGQHNRFLGLYGLVAGAEKGDRWQVELIGPGGDIVLEKTAEVQRDSAMDLFGAGIVFTGSERPNIGHYRGRFSLLRLQASGTFTPVLQGVVDIEVKR